MNVLKHSEDTQQSLTSLVTPSWLIPLPEIVVSLCSDSSTEISTEEEDVAAAQENPIDHFTEKSMSDEKIMTNDTFTDEQLDDALDKVLPNATVPNSVRATSFLASVISTLFRGIAKLMDDLTVHDNVETHQSDSNLTVKLPSVRLI